MIAPVMMVGVSANIRAVQNEIAYAARSDAKVLITGESGVGKEVVARLIHQRSNRSGHPLVTINCAGLPDSLLESELFGHLRGSFTDAHRDRAGWLQTADGGTAFMDEVGEMSLRMQALLLRFLETGEIQRLGADRALPRIDTRIITATNRSLSQRVAEKQFREDLYYRLNVINIRVPPLRERREDVLPLLQHFLAAGAETHRMAVPQLSARVLKALTDYNWPGNVRELRNVAERIVIRSAQGAGDDDLLPADITASAGAPAAAERPPAHVEELFRRLVTHRASFWDEVHDRYMDRELNRLELQWLIRLGLEHTHGSYKLLVSAFHLPSADYRRFMTFVHKHRCHVPYARFRTMDDTAQSAD